MPCFSCIVDNSVPVNIRLDRYVSEVLRLFSRSQIKARNLKPKVNGKEVKISRTVKPGDSLELFWDDAQPQNIVPQDIPLDIIYEDKRHIVVNKAQGMVVHPGAGNSQGTLANALLFKMVYPTPNPTECLSGSEYESLKLDTWLSAGRPGIVHRLDKDTSGVIIAAYDEETHAFLAQQFKNRKVRKTYIAIVCHELGLRCKLEKKGRIETFIARDQKDRKRFTVSERGRIAVTFYKVIKSWKNYSLVLLFPRTGRTHQLRVHMRYIGCPILGDYVYGGKDKRFPNSSLMLHSKSLEITLFGEPEARTFSAPLPQRFCDMLGMFKE